MHEWYNAYRQRTRVENSVLSSKWRCLLSNTNKRAKMLHMYILVIQTDGDDTDGYRE